MYLYRSNMSWENQFEELNLMSVNHRTCYENWFWLTFFSVLWADTHFQRKRRDQPETVWPASFTSVTTSNQIQRFKYKNDSGTHFYELSQHISETRFTPLTQSSFISFALTAEILRSALCFMFRWVLPPGGSAVKLHAAASKTEETKHPKQDFPPESCWNTDLYHWICFLLFHIIENEKKSYIHSCLTYNQVGHHGNQCFIYIKHKSPHLNQHKFCPFIDQSDEERRTKTSADVTKCLRHFNKLNRPSFLRVTTLTWSWR